MRHAEPEGERAEQPRGTRIAQRPVSPSSDWATMTSASAPAKTKKKAAYRPWSATDPTLTCQARA